jgi:SAM-dependent methyltransferase
MKSNFSLKCKLCNGDGSLLFETRGKKYYQCPQCLAVFLDPACYVSREEEKLRYEAHNNNVDDPGYQRFVEPITSGVIETCSNKHKGLDFGSGTGSAVAKFLKERGYDITLYDPLFCDCPKVLTKKYDFVVCCEVIEHFHFPKKEFELLRSLLNPGGILFCMTDLYSEKTDFLKWYYKDDSTHVFFYHQNTFEWIKTHMGFSALKITGRVAQYLL